MGHRPMYCSNADGDDCTQNESKVSFFLVQRADITPERELLDVSKYSYPA